MFFLGGGGGGKPVIGPNYSNHNVNLYISNLSYRVCNLSYRAYVLSNLFYRACVLSGFPFIVGIGIPRHVHAQIRQNAEFSYGGLLFAVFICYLKLKDWNWYKCYYNIFELIAFKLSDFLKIKIACMLIAKSVSIKRLSTI